MKRLIAIILVVLLLLNTTGYYGILVALRYGTSQNLIQRLDADEYSDAETFTLKMPMAVPYQEGQASYQRINGEIEYHGNVYRLVKQKLENDTLYVVCLSDMNGKRINNTMKDYVKTFADKGSDHKQSTKALADFIKDFLPTQICLSSGSEGWNHPLSMYSLSESPVLNAYISILSPPPRS